MVKQVSQHDLGNNFDLTVYDDGSMRIEDHNRDDTIDLEKSSVDKLREIFNAADAPKPAKWTIELMEEKAKAEHDGSCVKKLGVRWLEAIWYGAGGGIEGYFKYLYDDKEINRTQAIRLLEIGQN